MIVEGTLLDMLLNILTFPLQLVEFIVNGGLSVLFFDVLRIGS